MREPIVRFPMPETHEMRRYALAYFYKTGEPLNPWRCECCVTQKQLAAYNRRGADSLVESNEAFCCRRCGIYYVRH